MDGKVRIGTQLDTKGFSKGLKALKVLAVGAGVAKIFADMSKNFAGFQTVLAKSSTLFGDVNVNMTNLESKMLSLSSATGETAESLGEGLYTALSAGIPVTEDMGEALAFMETNAKLAKAGFTDVQTSVGATSKVLNAYKMDVSEIDRVSNILMATQNKGITTVGELSQYLAQVTPVASAMGVSFEEVGASLATITAQGTPTAQATTQLRQTIAELGKEGTVASKNLKEVAKSAGLGEASFSDMIDSGMTLDEILKLMGDYAEANNMSMIDMFSSIEAGQGALALSGNNSEKFAENLEYMANSAGLYETAYETMAKTLTTQFNILKSSTTNLGISIAEAFGDDLANTTGNVADFVESLRVAFESGGVSGLIEGLFDSIINTMTSSLSGIGDNFDTFIEDVTIFLTNIIQKISDKAPEFFNVGLDLIGEWASGFFELIPTVAGTLIGSLSAMIANVFNNTKDKFKEVGKQYIISIANGVGDTVHGLYVGFRTLAGNLGLIFLETDWKAIGKELIAKVSNGIGAQATALGQKVWDLAKNIGYIFVNAWKIATTDLTFKEVFQQAFDDIEQVDISGGISTLTDFGEAVGEAFKVSAEEAIESSETLGTFGDAFVNAFDNSKKETQELVEPLEKVGVNLDDLKKKGEDAVKVLGGDDVKKVATTWKDIGDSIKDGVASSLGLSTDELDNFIDGLDNSEGMLGKVKYMLESVGDSVASGLLNVFDDTMDALADVTLGSKSWADVMVSVGESIMGSLGDILKEMAKQLAGVAIVKALAGDWAGAGLATAGALALGYTGSLLSKAGLASEEEESGGTTYEEDKQAEAESLRTQISTTEQDRDRAKEMSETATNPTDVRYYTELYLDLEDDLVDLRRQLQFAQGFSTGGIVGGSSYTGDKLLAFVNSKELIFNQKQQSALARKLGNLSAMASGGTTLVVNVNGDTFGVDDFYNKVYNGIKQAQYEGALRAW